MFCGTVFGKHCCICCKAHRVPQNCVTVIFVNHMKALLLALSFCVTCVSTSLCVCFIVRNSEHIFACVVSSLYNDTLQTAKCKVAFYFFLEGLNKSQKLVSGRSPY